MSKWLYEAYIAEEWKQSTGMQYKSECRMNGGLCVAFVLELWDQSDWIINIAHVQSSNDKVVSWEEHKG